jgi:[ribosomal protein S18]-alanine N-acetyltransferase
MGSEDDQQRVSAHVRRFCPEDADAVMAIVAESPQAANWSRKSYLDFANEDGTIALVIEAGDSVTSFFFGRRVEDQAEILNLAVVTRRRREGQGAKLLKAALAEFRLRGAKSVYLEVRESNSAAIAFYEAHGFAKTGLRRGYYHQPDEPAITMERKFTASIG